MATPAPVVSQMLDSASDESPSGWRERLQTMETMGNPSPDDEVPCTLREWLEEVYFDGNRRAELTKEDLIKVCSIVERLLRFEPSNRALARDIVDDSWATLHNMTKCLSRLLSLNLVCNVFGMLLLHTA